MHSDLDNFLHEWHNSKSYIVAHTSGSTGAPKEIKLSKEDMLKSAKMTIDAFSIGKDSILYCPLSFDYIAGKMMAVRAIAAGARLLYQDASNTISLPDCNINLLAIVPSQVDSLLTYENICERVKTVIIGGAALSPKRKQMLLEAGVNAWITYGMTETYSHVALQHITDNNGIFKAMPGITFTSESDGRLTINAPEFEYKRLTTNDIVELIDAKSFKLLGRADNVINSGGIKIHPEQVEQLLSPFIPFPFYIKKEHDEKWGEHAELVIEGEEGCVEDLPNILEQILHHHIIPKEIKYVRELKRTRTGKIIR